MLKNLSIGRKLTLGFSLVLLLMLVVAVTGFNALSKSSDGFGTYRGLARNANLSGRIQAMVLYNRMNFKTYMSSNADEDKEKFQERQIQMQGFIQEAKQDIQNVERAALVATVKQQADLYGSTFEKITKLIDTRNHAVHDQLDVLGPDTERELSEIMASAKTDRDMTAAYNVGQGLKHFLLMRLYVMKYLEENSQANLERVAKEHASLSEYLATLDRELQNPGRRRLLADVQKNVTEYFGIWSKELTPAITERNKLIATVMDVAGPAIADEIEKVKLSIQAEQDELGPALVASNKASVTIIVIMTIISVIFGLFVALYLTRLITTGIMKIVEGIERLGQNDLTSQVVVDSNDEIGRMAKTFNAAMVKLRNVMVTITESSRQVATAGSQISAASEQMAAGAEEQQAQLSEVATSIEEMSAMILETSNNAAQTQDNANEANRAAEKGRGTVAQTISGIEGIATIVKSTSDQISKLKQRSQEIADVIQVIDDISDQTNLLALNANIEAARAGDAGRGFAVVADEVRKLAERTVKATADIEEKIKRIQVDVNASVEAMGQITVESQKGQGLAGEAGQALNLIGGSIEQVNAAISQIASAAIEQSAGVEEISKNVESVSTVSKQSASSAQELAASSEQLNGEVQALDKLVGQFRV